MSGGMHLEIRPGTRRPCSARARSVPSFISSPPLRNETDRQPMSCLVLCSAEAAISHSGWCAGLCPERARGAPRSPHSVSSARQMRACIYVHAVEVGIWCSGPRFGPQLVDGKSSAALAYSKTGLVQLPAASWGFGSGTERHDT